jgi:hypothetical protein
MATFAGKLNVGGNTIPIAHTLFGTCDSSVLDQTKVVTCANFDTYLDGLLLLVLFTDANSYSSSIYLNVNSKGQRQVKISTSTPAGITPYTSWNAGSIVPFVYYNNVWYIVGYKQITWQDIGGDWPSTLNIGDGKFIGSGELPGGYESSFELGSFHLIFEESDGQTTHNTIITGGSITIDGQPVSTGVGLQPTVLWTNPSPSASFAAQTITLSDALSGYTYYELIYKSTASSNNFGSTGLLPIDCDAQLSRTHARNSVRGYTLGTNMGNAYKISINDAVQFTNYGNTTTTTQNTYLVPYQVIGFK